MISAPEGRKSLSESFAPPGLRSKMTPPPGLRPGLHSVAAPRLNTGAIDGNPEVVAEVGARAAVLFIFVGSDAHPVPDKRIWADAGALSTAITSKAIHIESSYRPGGNISLQENLLRWKEL